ncbi:MAG TPA: outer membrane beta-barrel protein [Prolixibacteraceae bacterium]|nr:outer membrane beta-barrel protein [Prolixibacteraceae bacterium]
MRKSALFILYFVFVASLSSFAQKNENEPRKSQIGITFSSFGENDVVRSQELIGSASKNGDTFYTFGINYVYKLNHTFDVETGIEYSNHKILVKSMVLPDMDAYSPNYSANLSLVNIPVTLRVNFLKYCFVNGGLLFEMDASTSSPIDGQTGLGSMLGLGIKYDFKSGLSVFANPYYKMHSLVPFTSGDNHQRLMESGFRFGLMYKLK